MAIYLITILLSICMVIVVIETRNIKNRLNRLACYSKEYNKLLNEITYYILKLEVTLSDEPHQNDIDKMNIQDLLAQLDEKLKSEVEDDKNI